MHTLKKQIIPVESRPPCSENDDEKEELGRDEKGTGDLIYSGGGFRVSPGGSKHPRTAGDECKTNKRLSEREGAGINTANQDGKETLDKGGGRGRGVL